MKVLRFNEWLNESNEEKKGLIKIVFVGDIMQHQKQLEHEEDENFSYDGVFDEIKYIFENADMVVGNLETTFSGEFGNKQKDGQVHFSAHDKLAIALKEAGITHIGLANNHIMDHGVAGYQRTRDVLSEAGLIPLKTKNLFEVGEYKLELYNFTTHVNAEVTDEIKEEIMNENLSADLQADFNLAFVHWGGQYTPQEIKEQVTLANSLKTRGYEIVIGSGPHEVHRTEISENSIISYSLGDFLAGHLDTKAKDEGAIIAIEINESQLSSVTVYNTVSKTDDGDTKIDIKSREVLL
jgi:poly-gamma-glutamate capsule biosynthesis protein CapA/YwtB (metallophosphatase superfamily)